MDKQEFIKVMAEEAAQYGKIEFKEIQKVDETYYGMYVSVDNGPTPVVNLDSLYDYYCDTEDMDSCLEHLSQVLTMKPRYSFDISKISDWEWAKDHLYFKLFGHVVNGICKPVADLYLVPYVDLPDICGATVRVTPDLAETWEVSLDDIFQAVETAQPNLHPAVIKSLSDILGVMLPDDEEIPMYVVTCEDHYYGASAILYPGVAEQVKEKIYGDDFYLVPASVHEMLAVPKALCDDPQHLTGLVKMVNQQDVPEDQRLSNSIYEYDFVEDTLKKVEV